MKPFNGYKAIQTKTREILPPGGYVATIKHAAIEQTDWGDKLVISFDILEGNYKDFFAKDYKEQIQEDKKWRGNRRISVPADDGSEKDEWSKNTFGRATWAIEESNPGYVWDWNEAGLKGKVVGVLFREKEWEMNGNTGWTTECCAFASADDIRNGKFKMPKAKPLANKQTDGFAPLPDDSEVPFL